MPIVNCSMGTFLRPSAPDPIRRAVDRCYDQGVILVAAAGNVPAPNWPAFPAALARSIAVAGVTSEGKRRILSSYGTWIDLSAPAKEVRRAETREGPVFSYCADTGGTTFSAALTYGAAALWLARHYVELDRWHKEPWQRVEAFRSMSRQACKLPSTWDPKGGMGSGILHLPGLMDASRLPPAGVMVQR